MWTSTLLGVQVLVQELFDHHQLSGPETFPLNRWWSTGSSSCLVSICGPCSAGIADGATPHGHHPCVIKRG
jgi:hypothetical protein